MCQRKRRAYPREHEERTPAARSASARDDRPGRERVPGLCPGGRGRDAGRAGPERRLAAAGAAFAAAGRGRGTGTAGHAFEPGARGAGPAGQVPRRNDADGDRDGDRHANGHADKHRAGEPDEYAPAGHADTHAHHAGFDTDADGNRERDSFGHEHAQSADPQKSPSSRPQFREPTKTATCQLASAFREKAKKASRTTT